jgi:hypothetical protein
MSLEKQLFELSAKATYASKEQEDRNEPSNITYTVKGSDGTSKQVELETGKKVDLNASLQSVLTEKIGDLAANTQALSATDKTNVVGNQRINYISELKGGDYVAITTNGQPPAQLKYNKGDEGFYGQVESVDLKNSIFTVKFRTGNTLPPFIGTPAYTQEVFEVPLLRNHTLAVWKVSETTVRSPPAAVLNGLKIVEPTDTFKALLKNTLPAAVSAANAATAADAAAAQAVADAAKAVADSATEAVITLNESEGELIGLSKNQIEEINRQLKLLGVKKGGDILSVNILNKIKSLNKPSADGKITLQAKDSAEYKDNVFNAGTLHDADWDKSAIIGSISQDKIMTSGLPETKIHIVVIPPGTLVGSYITDGRKGKNYKITNVENDGTLVFEPEFKPDAQVTKGGKRKSHKRRKNRRRGTRKQ